MVPVEHPVHREVWIGGGGVGDVAYESVDIVLICGEPGRVKVADNSGCVDEVSKVKMVVIVICVAKINTRIACNVGTARYNTPPSRYGMVRMLCMTFNPITYTRKLTGIGYCWWQIVRMRFSNGPVQLVPTTDS